MKYHTGVKSKEEIAQAVAELLGKMTLEEKLGQMVQLVGADITSIGSTTRNEPADDLIRAGLAGSMIQVAPPKEMAKHIRYFQTLAAEESRLGIPLLFCQDVIHGFETVFPIPLAWSCSFDTALIGKAAEAAAKEASCCGLHMTFAPMVDLARDPRWGRVAESAGEDPWLGAEIAKALVRGTQGEYLGADDQHIAACLKHFIGYGAGEGGRDYNTVQVSDRSLHNYYLPPFQAGINAGAAAVMASFNVVDDIPAVANRHLLQEILRKECGFEGVIISDYSAVMELMLHGVAANEAEAARKAALAGLDIEMTTSYFTKHLPELIQAGAVPMSVVDAAVEHILTLKYRLGLMDDPFRFLREDDIDRTIYCQEHLNLSRELAVHSSVLLKNDGTLPLACNSKVALLGPFGDNPDLCGCWSFSFHRAETVTIAQGLRDKGVELTIEPGCQPLERLDGGIERAVKAAMESDVVVLALGETSVISGEACSRMEPAIPAPQRELAEAIVRTGKPVVLVLTNGRPLLLEWFHEHMGAILEVWAPGSQGGHAVADLLVGDADPRGKLTLTFPRHTGQIPMYYNTLPTGRPFVAGSGEHFQSGYLEGRNDPLYPFGFGLTYTTIICSNLTLSSETMPGGGCITAGITVENTGSRSGEEVVQLYLRDSVASVSRPVKELKGIQLVRLNPGERREIVFEITDELLRYYTADGVYAAENGKFEVMIGTSSSDRDLLKGEFERI